MKSQREKFPTRKFRLVGEPQLNTVMALISHLPLDSARPLEIIVREEVKGRKLDQLALMWAGPLKDISEQGYLHGRRFSDAVWHHFFKEQFLPEEYDPELCKSESYRKWDFDPIGNKILVGSTGDLTIKGFAEYLEQVMAFGANIGVQFHANPNEARRFG
jgi:hypothetical protein